MKSHAHMEFRGMEIGAVSVPENPAVWFAFQIQEI